MGAVVDIDDQDGVVLLIDAKQDAVITAAGAAHTLELIAKRLAQPARVLRQRTADELDDRVHDAARQA
jgi:hypothetical protein